MNLSFESSQNSFGNESEYSFSSRSPETNITHLTEKYQDQRYNQFYQQENPNLNRSKKSNSIQNDINQNSLHDSGNKAIIHYESHKYQNNQILNDSLNKSPNSKNFYNNSPTEYYNNSFRNDRLDIEELTHHYNSPTFSKLNISNQLGITSSFEKDNRNTIDSPSLSLNQKRSPLRVSVPSRNISSKQEKIHISPNSPIIKSKNLNNTRISRSTSLISKSVNESQVNQSIGNQNSLNSPLKASHFSMQDSQSRKRGSHLLSNNDQSKKKSNFKKIQKNFIQESNDELIPHSPNQGNSTIHDETSYLSPKTPKTPIEDRIRDLEYKYDNKIESNNQSIKKNFQGKEILTVNVPRTTFSPNSNSNLNQIQNFNSIEANLTSESLNLNISSIDAVEHFIKTLPKKKNFANNEEIKELTPRNVVEMDEMERLDALVSTIKRKQWIKEQLNSVNNEKKTLDNQKYLIQQTSMFQDKKDALLELEISPIHSRMEQNISNSINIKDSLPKNFLNDSLLIDIQSSDQQQQICLPMIDKSTQIDSELNNQKEENMNDDIESQLLINKDYHLSNENSSNYENENQIERNLIHQNKNEDTQIANKLRNADSNVDLIKNGYEITKSKLTPKTPRDPDELNESNEKNLELSQYNLRLPLENSPRDSPLVDISFDTMNRQNNTSFFSDSLQETIMYYWKHHEYENLLNEPIETRFESSLNNIRIDSEIYQCTHKKHPLTTIHEFNDIFRSMQLKIQFFLDLNLTIEEINTLMERQECIPKSSLKSLWNSIKGTKSYQNYKQRQLLSKYYKYRAELWGAHSKSLPYNDNSQNSLLRSTMNSPRIQPLSLKAISPPGLNLISPRSQIQTPRLKSKTIKLSQFTNIDQLQGHEIYFHSVTTNSREDYIIDAVGEIHPYGRKFFLSDQTIEDIRLKYRLPPKVIRGIVLNCTPANGGFRYGVKKTSKFAIIDLELT